MNIYFDIENIAKQGYLIEPLNYYKVSESSPAYTVHESIQVKAKIKINAAIRQNVTWSRMKSTSLQEMESSQRHQIFLIKLKNFKYDLETARNASNSDNEQIAK